MLLPAKMGPIRLKCGAPGYLARLATGELDRRAIAEMHRQVGVLSRARTASTGRGCRLAAW